LIGQRINNYEIKALLGEGGMGAVYLAEHPLIGRKVAVKVLRRELTQDPTMVQRFINEARAANAIRSGNIVEVLDVGVLPDGLPYLIMEFLDGESVARRIERLGRLPAAEAVEIASDTAAALGAAHAAGIVHRDLKPDNLYLSEDSRAPGRPLTKVLDFGIAKLRGDFSPGAIKTVTGVLMGTPRYMSPEQCKGIASEIDHRTDIYALGVILYEMVTGAPPFVSDGFGVVLMMHISQPPLPPRLRNPDVSPELEAIIQRALEKDRDRRYGSMEELRRALAPVRQAVGPAAWGDAPAPRAGAEVGAQPAAPQPATEPLAPLLRPLTTLATSAGTVEAPPATPAGRSGGWRKVVLAGAAAVALVIVFGGVLARRRSHPLPEDPLPRTRALLPGSSPVPPTAPFDERVPPDTAPAPAAPAATASGELQGAQLSPRNAEPPASPRARKTAGKPRGGRSGSGNVVDGRQASSSATASTPPATGPAVPASAVPASAPGEAPSSLASPAPSAPRVPAKVKKW
jgi:serine/threonine-protein kinase